MRTPDQYIPLNLVDLPGFHRNKQSTKEILGKYLKQTDITVLIVVPWSVGAGTNVVLYWMSEFINQHMRDKATAFRTELKKRSAIVFTKCDQMGTDRFGVPISDFSDLVDKNNCFFTGYGSKDKQPVDLVDIEEDFFQEFFQETVRNDVKDEDDPKKPKLRIEKSEGQCGTDKIINYIGNQYDKHVNDLKVGIINLLKKSREEFAGILKEKWMYWNDSKENGFWNFRADLIVQMKTDSEKIEKMESCTFDSRDYSKLLGEFKKLLLDICTKWDSRWNRFDFFWDVIKGMIDDVLNQRTNDIEELLKAMNSKHSTLVAFSETVSTHGFAFGTKKSRVSKLTGDIVKQENDLFCKREFLLCLDSVCAKIKTFQPNEIKENKDFLSLFDSYRAFRDFDLDQSRDFKPPNGQPSKIIRLFSKKEIDDFRGSQERKTEKKNESPDSPFCLGGNTNSMFTNQPTIQTNDSFGSNSFGSNSFGSDYFRFTTPNNFQ